MTDYIQKLKQAYQSGDSIWETAKQALPNLPTEEIGRYADAYQMLLKESALRDGKNNRQNSILTTGIQKGKSIDEVCFEQTNSIFRAILEEPVPKAPVEEIAQVSLSLKPHDYVARLYDTHARGDPIFPEAEKAIPELREDRSAIKAYFRAYREILKEIIARDCKANTYTSNAVKAVRMGTPIQDVADRDAHNIFRRLLADRRDRDKNDESSDEWEATIPNLKKPAA